MDEFNEKLAQFESEMKNFGRIRQFSIFVFVLLFSTFYGILVFSF